MGGAWQVGWRDQGVTIPTIPGGGCGYSMRNNHQPMREIEEVTSVPRGIRLYGPGQYDGMVGLPKKLQFSLAKVDFPQSDKYIVEWACNFQTNRSEI